MTDVVGIRVHDLKDDMDKSDLVQAFTDANIGDCKAKTFLNGKTEKRMACVQFNSHEDAKKALEMGTIKVREDELKITSCCRCRGNDDTAPNSMCPSTIFSEVNSGGKSNTNSISYNGENRITNHGIARSGSNHSSSSFDSMAYSMCPATDAATVSTARYSIMSTGREAEVSGNAVNGSKNGTYKPEAKLPPRKGAESAGSVKVPLGENVAETSSGNPDVEKDVPKKSQVKKAKTKKPNDSKKNGKGGKAKPAKNCLKNKAKKPQVEKKKALAFEASENTQKLKRNAGKKGAQKKPCSGELRRCCKKADVYAHSDGEDEAPQKYSHKNHQE